MDIAEFLDQVTQLRRRAVGARVSRIYALLRLPALRAALREKQELAARKKLLRELSAERFNVFSSLLIDRRENYHSRFLAYLLNPTEAHDQGAFFLLRFLRRLGLPIFDKWPEAVLQTSRVVTEQYADEFGRIDLVIFLPEKHILAIENKIDHIERPRQLVDYRAWLDRRSATKGGFLVFLTPDGRISEDVDAIAHARVDAYAAYGDLVGWLDACVAELPSTTLPLLVVLRQYAALCKSISGEPEMSDKQIDFREEVVKLFKNPENLEAALEVARYLEREKELLRNDFVENVCNIVRVELSTNGVSGEWVCANDGAEGFFGIRHRRHTNSVNANYSCVVEKLFNGGWYGWRRPQWADMKGGSALETATLSAQMLRDGLRPAEAWWVGWHKLPTDGPLVRWDDETILGIQRDNLDPEHPLARNLALLLWEIFVGYRKDIECLSGYKAAAI